MSSPSPLARFWSHAQAALTALCASLMPLDTLTAGEQRALRTWLRALEVFCRRIALTEALALARGAWCGAVRAASRAIRAAAKPCRRPTLHLWPKTKRAAARIRLLGAPTSAAEIEAARKHAALAARLTAARGRRKPARSRLADRIEALQRFLDAPARALHALARKLRQTPKLAFHLTAARAPNSPFLSRESVQDCEALCCAAVLDSS